MPDKALAGLSSVVQSDLKSKRKELFFSTGSTDSMFVGSLPDYYLVKTIRRMPHGHPAHKKKK